MSQIDLRIPLSNMHQISVSVKGVFPTGPVEIAVSVCLIRGEAPRELMLP